MARNTAVNRPSIIKGFPSPLQRRGRDRFAHKRNPHDPCRDGRTRKCEYPWHANALDLLFK